MGFLCPTTPFEGEIHNKGGKEYEEEDDEIPWSGYSSGIHTDS